MSESEPVKYVALLGNVDKSILQVDFGDGFQVRPWSTDAFVSFYEEMHGSAEHDILFKLDEDWGYSNRRVYRPKTVYVIEKSLQDFPLERANISELEWRDELYRRMDYERDQSALLEDKIRKLRLCAPGSIKVCVEFFYSGDGEMQASTEEGLHCTNRLFKVRKADLPGIKRLLKEPPLVGTQKYLAFALDNYNQSYRVAQRPLEFISLMLAFEAIFNDGKQELRNKVARGCAVLLGRSKDESRRVFKDVKDLYDKRSVLVHTGDVSKIREAEIQMLHSYVRRSLAQAVTLNLPKEKFSVLLQEAGFGQRFSLAKLAGERVFP